LGLICFQAAEVWVVSVKKAGARIAGLTKIAAVYS
jgi:hypothetical protein